MKCTHCGHTLPDGARFCNKCGQPVAQTPAQPEKQEQGKKCPHCGQSLMPGARFCNRCGQPVAPEAAPETPAPEKTVPAGPDPKTQAPAEENPRPPQQEAAGKRRRSPLGLVLAVVVVLLVLLAAAGWWWFGSHSKEAPAAPASSAAEPLEEEAEEPDSQPAASAASEEAQTPESQPAASEEAEAQPPAESTETAPAEQAAGRQEIRIVPQGDGTASLTLLQQDGGEWKTLFECEAAIGRNGTTDSPAEGDGKTPAGTFPVLFCYGLEQPDTTIPFIQLTPDSVWVDDSGSAYYNCLTTRQEAGSVSFEETYSQFVKGYYSCNIFFANNGDGRTPGSATPGLGSVRVLEGSLKPLEPTNGDIKISAENMETLLGMLDAAYSPVVTVTM